MTTKNTSCSRSADMSLEDASASASPAPPANGWHPRAVPLCSAVSILARAAFWASLAASAACSTFGEYTVARVEFRAPADVAVASPGGERAGDAPYDPPLGQGETPLARGDGPSGSAEHFDVRVARDNAGTPRLRWLGEHALPVGTADLLRPDGALEVRDGQGQQLLAAAGDASAFRMSGCAYVGEYFHLVRREPSTSVRHRSGADSWLASFFRSHPHSSEYEWAYYRVVRAALPCGDDAPSNRVPFVLTTRWSNVRALRAQVRHDRAAPVVAMLLASLPFIGLSGIGFQIGLSQHPTDGGGIAWGVVFAAIGGLVELALLPSVVAPDQDRPVARPSR